LGGLIAPIFFNTTQDSGGLPIMCDGKRDETGDVIIIDTEKMEIKKENGELLCKFELKPPTIKDEFRAGGRLNLIIGRSLTNKARAFLGLGESTVFVNVNNPEPKPNQGYTLAQRLLVSLRA